MEPLGGGAAEIRLYRRPSYGAALVQLAALDPVAPPRPLEVGPDPPGEEFDGELRRSPGLYLALFDGGKVVDVARLLTYAGEPAGDADAAENYWLTGSDTSEDRFRSTDQRRRRRSGDETNRSASSSEKKVGKNIHDRMKPGGHQEQPDDIWGWSTSSSAEMDDGEDEDDEDGEHVDGDDEEDRGYALDSVNEMTSSNEKPTHGFKMWQCQDDSATSGEDDDAEEDLMDEMGKGKQEKPTHGFKMWQSQDNSATSSEEHNAKEEDDDAEEDSMDEMGKGKQEKPTHRFKMWQSLDNSATSSEEHNAKEDDDEEEDKDDGGADGDEEDSMDEMAEGKHEKQTDRFKMRQYQDYSATSGEEDDDGAERGSDKGGHELVEGDGKEEHKEGSGEEDDYEDEEQGRSLKLKLRIWPAKKHLCIKIFCGKKWMATKVYRLAWADHEELEELFESSFELDIGAPIPINTVFRIRDCHMDFEVVMFHTPDFDTLLAEFKPSVGDFHFCKKLGGEGDCRVFKCLSQGSMFALKTLRLEEYHNSEPREVEIISSLKDKRVMAFYQAWIEPWIYKKKPVSDYLFIQLELCESTLKDKLSIENFESIVDRWPLFEEMVKGVKTVHDEFIVHRDLKPGNVFFDSDMGVRIGDFGDACIGPDEFGGYGGTPNLGTGHYSAPELAISKKISEKADIYSIGVMFLEIFTRFQTVTEKSNLTIGLREKGLTDRWLSSDLVGDREGTRGLVERMIATDPAYRPSAADILDFIQQ